MYKLLYIYIYIYTYQTNNIKIIIVHYYSMYVNMHLNIACTTITHVIHHMIINTAMSGLGCT